MSYNDDNLALDYNILKKHPHHSPQNPLTLFPQPIYLPFNPTNPPRPTQDPKFPGNAPKEANAPIVVLDDDLKGDTAQESKKSMIRGSKIKKRGSLAKEKKKDGVRNKRGRKPKQLLGGRFSDYTVIEDDEVGEVAQMKKVKVDIENGTEDKVKESNSAKKKKGKKEEVKKKAVISLRENSTPNFLYNPIPNFFGKFETDNMYTINQLFYFDPIKVSL